MYRMDGIGIFMISKSLSRIFDIFIVSIDEYGSIDTLLCS